MNDSFLILAIIALCVSIYYRHSPHAWIGPIIVIILFFLSTICNQLSTVEHFNAEDGSQGRDVCYGDIIGLFTWVNQFVRMNSNNTLDASSQMQNPNQIPRVGWEWEFFLIEDPREAAASINSNSNPIMYGDKIILRSTYRQSYIGISPSAPTQSTVMATNNWNEWSTFQIVSGDASAKGGQSVKYGDQLYLKTNKNPATYLSALNSGLIVQSPTQDNKSLFMITDRYGQGSVVDWARRGTATQSSYYENFVANNAIDGNNMTYNHTQDDNNAWWQVTLPRDTYITKINILNRQDCCKERLSNFDVTILDHNNVVVTSKYYEVAGNAISWDNINQIGRMVKVQLRNKNYLHMAEVNVYGIAVNYSLLLENPLSADVLNEPRIFSSTKPITDLTNTLSVSSVDLPYNNQSKSVSIAMFIKLLKTNPDETTIYQKGSTDNEKSPCITLVPGQSRLRLYYGTTQSSNQSFDDIDNLPLNQWIHVTYILDGGINENTGWQLGSFRSKIAQEPFEQCCYFIHPLLKQYYYLSADQSPSTAKANIWEPSVLQGMNYMGRLDSKLTRPRAFLYINGILRTTTELTTTPKLNTGALNIGKSPKLNLKSADFVIDQVKYYNYRVDEKLIMRLIQSPLQNVTKTLVYKMSDTLNPIKFQPNQLPYIENDFSVGFWLYTTRPINGNGQWNEIFLRGNQSIDRAPGMWFSPDKNTLHMPLHTKNQAYTWGEGILNSTFVFPPNEWHHVGLTLSDKVETLYIDGKQTDQATLSDSVIFTVSPMSIGGFPGQLYNFQFSNYAMNNDQIVVAMGQHPDEQYNQIIRKIWKDAGCLTNVIPFEQPNLMPEWRNYVKNDQTSRVEGLIREIRVKADAGDKKLQEMCYGKFTAGMLDKLAEKDQLIKYTIEKQREGTQCLPMAPFECQNKNINDFDIRTHKDFNKYTLSTRIQPCNGGNSGDITQSPPYVKLKQELDASTIIIQKLETLKIELEQEKNNMQKSVTDAATKAQLTEQQLMQYPAFAELKRKYDIHDENLRKVNAELVEQKKYCADTKKNLNNCQNTDITKDPRYVKLLAENERNRKIAQTNLLNNLDLSELKNNPLFMQTLEDIRQQSLKPGKCTSDQIINSNEYIAMKKQINNNNECSNQLAAASQISQLAVDEANKTKKLAADLLEALGNIKIDDQTMQQLLSGEIDVKSLIDQNGHGNKGSCANLPIEQHPGYAKLIDKINGTTGIPDAIRCWGCQLPKY